MPAYSPYASPKATIRRLNEWSINTKKSLGQHFLVDDGVVGRILRLSKLGAGDQVLEIGPGIGTLTEAMLLKGANVVAIEKDQRLLPLLEDTKKRYPKTFEFLSIDALDYIKDIDPLVEAPTKLIANLPYAVAATIVLDYFQFIPKLDCATVMVQKEVADRMAAKPGTKNYGAYSVKLQLVAHPSETFKVAPSCFLPPPRVDSAVIRIARRSDEAALELTDLRNTFVVIEAAFARRRKTIRNSMCAYFEQHNLDPRKVDLLLEAANIAPKTRGEALSPSQFLNLGQIYSSTLSLP